MKPSSCDTSARRAQKMKYMVLIENDFRNDSKERVLALTRSNRKFSRQFRTFHNMQSSICYRNSLNERNTYIFSFSDDPMHTDTTDLTMIKEGEDTTFSNS